MREHGSRIRFEKYPGFENTSLTLEQPFNLKVNIKTPVRSSGGPSQKSDRNGKKFKRKISKGD
ncbi:hypothetical protein RSJ42_04345 [Methanosarcina hadiensis]|uniref:hypothetical protein n=1 Tax=Methanosarcina hadiensis TaxID=3078083 RepID=UPI003977398B